MGTKANMLCLAEEGKALNELEWHAQARSESWMLVCAVTPQGGRRGANDLSQYPNFKRTLDKYFSTQNIEYMYILGREPE